MEILTGRAHRQTRRDLSVGVATEFIGNVAAVGFVGAVALATGLIGDLEAGPRATVASVVLIASFVALYLPMIVAIRDRRAELGSTEDSVTRYLRRTRRGYSVVLGLSLAAAGISVTGVLRGNSEIALKGAAGAVLWLLLMNVIRINRRDSRRAGLRENAPSRDVGFPG